MTIRLTVLEASKRSAHALFVDGAGGLPLSERATAALRTAERHQDAELADFYRSLAGAQRAPGRADRAAHRAAQDLHVDLLSTHPVDATAGDQSALADAGLSFTEIVQLSQVIAFVSFQTRAVTTLRALRGVFTPGDRHTGIRVAAAREPFTQEQLGWTPWLPPLELADLSDEQRTALSPPRDSPYFRLLARDARVLQARTETDEAIFRTSGGLPRAERELAAAVASRVNGCVYCASVHSRFASTFSHRPDDVQRLLDCGPGAPQDPRWRVIVDAAAALSQTPPMLTAGHLTELRGQGLVDLEIFDLGLATAFFAWANRLMLTLGEPVFPDRPRTQRPA